MSVARENVEEMARVAPVPEDHVGESHPDRSRILLSPPDMSQLERNALLRAFDSGWVAPAGPEIEAFEREFAAYVGVPHAVAVSSGTAALHLALSILGVGARDEVATATMTFVASANAIRYTGATPVFVDSESRTWNMDAELLASELESRRRSGRQFAAVLAVDVFGRCAEYEKICWLCSEFGIPLIEDAAEALGSKYLGKPAGGFGDIGCFSFNGNKIITTGGGGMLVTSRREWADQARHLATQAREPVAHYEHERLGFNYRMSNPLAAIGRGQLSRLDDFISRRRACHAFYRETLEPVPGLHVVADPFGSESNCWLSCLSVDAAEFGATRDEVIEALSDQNIESRPVWKPMHLQPLYRDCQFLGSGFSDKFFETGVCLPSGSSLERADLSRITDVILGLARPNATQTCQNHGPTHVGLPGNVKNSRPASMVGAKIQ